MTKLNNPADILKEKMRLGLVLSAQNLKARNNYVDA